MEKTVEVGPTGWHTVTQDVERREAGEHGASEPALREERLGLAGTELWSALVREWRTPTDDTRTALQAVRASLDAARRLRFAEDVSEEERHRLTALAVEAAEVQEHALRLWYQGRDFSASPTAETLPSITAPNIADDTRNVCFEVTNEKEFASLREAWSTLLSESSYPSPFCTWEWAWEWWCHFGTGVSPGYRLLVALAYRADGRLIGLAPFFFPGTKAGALRLQSLRPLATRIHCMVDDMTEEPIILLRRGETQEALQGLWAALGAWKGRQSWDLLHLRLMRPAAEPDLRSVWRRMPKTLPFVLTRPRQRAGQTRSLPGSWPEFRRSLGKSMRDNVAYYPRLLTRDDHAWSVEIARAPDEVDKAVSALISLHGCRAQSGRGPAHQNHFPGSAQKRFLRGILVRLAAQDQAAVALLEIDGTPIAAQAVLEIGGQITFYYSGFDPHWHRYGPVTILHIALIQDAIARGLTSVDYLPEAEPWKTRWGTEAAYIYDELSCLAIHPRALLRSAWRQVTYQRSRRRGSACECGFCTPEEQATGLPAALLALNKNSHKHQK